MRGRRVKIAERALAGVLHPPLKALPKKKLADLELVQAPGERRLLPLTITVVDCGA